MGAELTRRKDAWRERVLWCGIVFVVALGVRAGHLWEISAAPFFPFMIGDAEAYDLWGREIAAGDWLGDGVFYQAPLYPYFLGAVYSLLGDDVMVVRKVQAILGALACVFLMNAGWRLFSKRTGIAAGLILAVYAPAIFFDASIQKSVLDLFFLCLALWLFSGVGVAARKANWLWLGMTIGALALSRENALVLVLPLLAWAVLGWRKSGNVVENNSWRQRVVFASLFIAGLAAVLFPVALRNKMVGGEFHLTTSQFGPNFYIGNNEQANGTYQPLRFGQGHARFERNDATEIAEEALGRKLTPAEVSAYWTQQSLDYIRAQPADWLRLLMTKLAMTWNAAELVDSEDQYTHAEYSLPLRLTGYVAHFGVLAPLAFVGVLITWNDWRKLWPLYLMVALLTLSVVIFFVFARYRFPLVPFLVLFAAAGLVEFGRYLRERAAWRAALCVAVAITVAVACNWPLLSTDQMRATSYTNIGNQLARHGRLDEAAEFYGRALRLSPDNALAHNNLGRILEEQRITPQAESHYRRALQIEPDYSTARRNLERLLSVQEQE